MSGKLKLGPVDALLAAAEALVGVAAASPIDGGI